MRQLLHYTLSAPSRFIRLLLAEKKLPFDLVEEKAWERRAGFLALNPAGNLPVLREDDGAHLCDCMAIAEFLEETYADSNLIGVDPLDRAESRRLAQWFDRKFAAEVTDLFVGEKVIRRLQRQGTPRSDYINAARSNIKYHLDYIGFLTERRNWLSGAQLSIADLAAGAHISVIDYLGDIPWHNHSATKEWYARLKSRPSFRPILQETLPGMPPPPFYADPDF